MSQVKLSAKWQLDAALLSRPVDLTSLVSLSRTSPEKFIEDNTLHRLVTLLLNEKNLNKADKDTKLDVLNILANVARCSSCVKDVRSALQGISEWFDEYIASEESDPATEPELHKAMVLLLARCWDYKLKTEDVLELTQGNRRIALCTVVGLLEDGETYSTVLKQRQKPGTGQMAQWEHELVVQKFERPLLLQICRLLRGFTHPGTYFEASESEIELYSIERFSEEMNTLLEITLRSRLVEKLCMAMYSCLFEDKADQGDDGELILEESDHIAVVSVHAFLQNLYFYASHNNDEFRRHMLVDTMLIPRLILPYLNCCVLHANILSNRSDAYKDVLDGDSRSANLTLDHPNLVKGIAASLRTLIIASFRAPATQYVVSLLRRLNPTASMLRAESFCIHHDYIYALLCLLNVNMGALDLSKSFSMDANVMDSYRAHTLLFQMATVYSKMSKSAQTAVYKRVVSSGALPVTRDTPSYVAVMSVLHGGAAGQLDYFDSESKELGSTLSSTRGLDEEDMWDSRAEAKRAHAERMEMARLAVEAASNGTGGIGKESKGYKDEAPEPKLSAFQIAIETAQEIDERRLEAKEAKAENKEVRRKDSIKNNKEQIRGEGYRLLGDLPTIGQPKNKQDVKVALSLELPTEATKPVPKMMIGGKEVSKAETAGDPSLPKEFLCAINGHVMKEPVRSKTSGLVFERATIELWLATRGSICPITLETLTREDLVPDEELSKKIMRYHIQKTSLNRAASMSLEDDLYDF